MQLIALSLCHRVVNGYALCVGRRARIRCDSDDHVSGLRGGDGEGVSAMARIAPNRPGNQLHSPTGNVLLVNATYHRPLLRKGGSELLRRRYQPFEDLSMVFTR